MKFSASDQILAVITMHRERVGGSAPIFYAKDFQELEKISLYLARIFMGAVHDLDNGVYIVVKH